MFRVLPPVLLALITVLASCEKEGDDEGYRAAGITFRSDTGYTHMDDTLGISDTVHIGALVAEGSERLRHVLVQYAIDGGQWVLHDSVPFAGNPMAVEVQAIMGSVPRTETWSILAVERNTGYTTRRNLTLTVTE